MSKKLVGAGSIQKGDTVLIDDAACKVVSTQTSKTGKHGHAKIRIQAVGIFDDKKRDIVLPSHDNIDVPIIEKKSAQVLSITGEMANVMDMETFETVDLKIPEELKGQIKEGTQVLYWQIMDQKLIKQIKGAGE